MKISYSLRAFAIYFVILGTLIWFTLDNAIERLNDGMRQSAESVIVDIANILAVVVEEQATEETSDNINSQSKSETNLNTLPLARIFNGVKARSLNAQIYRVTKTQVDSEVTITNREGIVIYDSTGKNLGKNHSKWRDVKLTLEGHYGARTSYLDQRLTEPGDQKIMVIAAPIMQRGEIAGVISVSKPINSLEQHLLTESNQLKQYAFGLLLLALAIGYLLSLWFTYALNKIALYANAMARGKPVDAPMFLDSRLSDLSASISNMRKQLDGKEYVEAYIHSLTHELKTPLTSIGGAVELLSEEMPDEDRSLFLNNIKTSNQRMSRLVDRMLSLAKLEGLTELVDPSEFDLLPSIKRLLDERHSAVEQAGINISMPDQASYVVFGDRVLLSQALANLIDNAIRFSHRNSQIEISLIEPSMRPESSPKATSHFQVQINNQGQQIPEYALPKIYDRFFSLPNTDADNATGKSNGLGLSFVKEIMKLHKGSIHIENTNNGVKATLKWPTRR